MTTTNLDTEQTGTCPRCGDVVRGDSSGVVCMSGCYLSSGEGRQALTTGPTVPVVFVEQEGGLIQDIRMNPDDSVKVVAFNWDAINEDNLDAAASYLADLVATYDTLAASAQALMADTIAKARVTLAQRCGSSR
ncbi:MAG: hypothetical protein OEO17_03680 [Gemmatimonadota bacterium]|nr:hypothetical protein [Gemmatimonadota bacterium]MDH5615067.1 hypothetical protein [Acidimicrobiia bacterium]